MIICPNTGDECPKLVKPISKSAFLMVTYPDEESNEKEKIKEIEEIKNLIFNTFDKEGYEVIVAKKRKRGRNLFCKICQQIQSAPVGVIVYTEGTPSRSFPNIFFELGVMSMLGKELILLKDYKTKIPSDLTGLEWIHFKNIKNLKEELSEQIKQFKNTSDEYKRVAKFYRDKGKLEKSIDYYKRAYLLNPKGEILTELKKLLKELEGVSKDDRYYALSIRLRDNLKYFLECME